MSAYAELAPYYDLIFPLNPAVKTFLAAGIVRCKQEKLPWLDVGCGTGLLVEWLRTEKIDAYGVDPDDESLAHASKRSVWRLH
jgi:2-polyprenyl-3-methyl-5-hydroxy-6-metoxy-1,4-benzoquinol methylase